MIKVRHEAIPFIGIFAVASICAGFFLKALMPGAVLFAVGTAGMLFFFRDPDRIPPMDPEAILSGADGRVMSITPLAENAHLNAACVRISVFLSAFDVHVNRAPLSGQSEFIGYYPGKKYFAFQEKSSEFNQHNKIMIKGLRTRCLVAQIVGPIARRVVYWLNHDKPVTVKAGDRIGMMKFGSRLDVYLPTANVDVLIKPGDRVRAGETVLARIKATGNGELK